MAQELVAVVQNSAPATVEYTTEQLATLQKTVAQGTTPAEFSLFIEVCKSTGLNPFAKQIYAIKRGDKLTIQTGIDGYRVLAERTGKYAGQVGPFWCGDDGVWKDAWLSATPPVACKVGVLRRDFSEPLWAVARTNAYTQKNNSLWTSMPDVMVAKCAEALALRKAFPEHISGVYTAEEMEQADNPPTAYVDATSQPAQRATGGVTKYAHEFMTDEGYDPLSDAQLTKDLASVGIASVDQREDAFRAIREKFPRDYTKRRIQACVAAKVKAFVPDDLTTLPVGERGQ